jgi:hypothetical protein
MSTPAANTNDNFDTIITIDINQNGEKFPLRFIYDMESKVSTMIHKKKEVPLREKAETFNQFLKNIGPIVTPEFSLAEWDELTNQIETLFLIKGENYISIGTEKYIAEHHTKE